MWWRDTVINTRANQFLWGFRKDWVVQPACCVARLNIKLILFVSCVHTCIREKPLRIPVQVESRREIVKVPT